MQNDTITVREQIVNFLPETAEDAPRAKEVSDKLGIHPRTVSKRLWTARKNGEAMYVNKTLSSGARIRTWVRMPSEAER